MSEWRCPYFSLSVGAISLPGQRQPIRVPICRCALTEIFVDRLKSLPEGQELTSYLEAPALDGLPRPIIGSNFQPISADRCTNQRRVTRCVLQFEETLIALELDATLPPEG